MLRYPELLAWEMLWTDSLRETYAAIYKKVKGMKPSLGVGWHICHNNSLDPIYRAEQDLAAIAPYSDFLKIVMYNNCAGERMAEYIESVGTTMYGDLPGRRHWTSTTVSWTTRKKVWQKYLSRDFRRTMSIVKPGERARRSRDADFAMARNRHRHPNRNRSQQVHA